MTLDWLDTLRQHGAAGSLLRWILADETDNRLHWWQELVVRAKVLQGRVRKLQDSFALPLHDAQSTMTLVAWSSQTADRNAKMTSALDVVESHSQSNDFTIYDLAQATAGLRRAIELEVALQSWKERLGTDATRLEVARIQNHRQWAAIARGLAPAMGDWLAATDTTLRCETLLGIESRLAALKKAIKRTQDSMGFFGRVSGDGPFAILSTSGTSREVEQHCEAFTARIPLLPNYAALLREQETAKTLGLGNLTKHAESAKISTNVLIDTFHGAVAYQQARSIWESDDELRYFQSNEHERLRQKFQDDDEKQLKTNRQFIKTRLGNRNVTEGWKGKTAGEHTELALLQHEMSKQRRHLPIRKLVHRAGRAMQDLCPCWMMTPLAVAQFLAPGAISFDLVIMDEASQINPEDAWGAIARGGQLVVVGDQKQMTDAREVIICTFIFIKVKLWQVYREFLPKFFCETWISLGLVSVHVERQTPLTTFLCPPLFEVDVNQNHRSEKRFIGSGIRFSLAPFEKPDCKKQSTVAGGICERVLFVPDFCEPLTECFVRQQ